jgi:hypothetical protein
MPAATVGFFGRSGVRTCGRERNHGVLHARIMPDASCRAELVLGPAAGLRAGRPRGLRLIVGPRHSRALCQDSQGSGYLLEIPSLRHPEAKDSVWAHVNSRKPPLNTINSLQMLRLFGLQVASWNSCKPRGPD